MSSKLFASRFLDTDFLSHLDVYKYFPDPLYRVKADFFSGGKKPDLIGQMRTGDWIAIEAKGRTNGFDLAAIATAKNCQLANLAAINTVPPRLKVAVQSFFAQGVLNVHLEDPENQNNAAKNLGLPEREMFLRHWYEPFLSLVEQQHQIRRHGDDQFLFIEFKEMDIKVGIDITLYKSLRNTEAQPTITNYAETRQSKQGEGWFIGREGILVELGPLWSAGNMVLEPYLRARQGR